ncbi:RNA polymerase sigma factor [Tunturiibacter gelidiferens]|uniref:RNA polymerase sigma factor n=1 Tax=Tunturiibacter gelidiferens TaxID=3069689 RepID=UPI003D9B9F00
MNSPIYSGSDVSLDRSSMAMNDELLVLAAKSGDTTAFVELRRRHATKVMRTIYRVTRNWEDAEDALQDSFLLAYLHLNKFENRSTFASWLTRIAVNSALMILRKKRPHEISIDDTRAGFEAGDKWELRDLRDDPEARYVQIERNEKLRSAILRLRPNLRDVLELQQTQEYSVKELAQVLGISSAAAKSRVLRARMALRASLQ